MNFYKRYELQRLIATGEAKTFRGVETATGRAVFVHMFDADKPGILSAMKSKLTVKGGLPVAPLLECGDFAGAEYAVTEPIEAFVSLREWVQSLPGPEQGTDQTPPRTPPSSASPGLLNDGTGEFSAAFPSQSPARPAPPSPLPAPALPTGAEPGEADMGDFTRAFGPAPASSNRIPAARIVPVPQPVPPPSSRRPVEPLPPNAPPDWSASGDTGEFTRLFGTGMAGEDIDIAEEQARAAQSPAQEHRPFQDAGEFTRVFGPEATEENPNPPRRPAPFGLNTSASGLFDDEEPVRSAGGSTIEADPPLAGGYNDTFGARPVQREQPKAGPPKQASPAQLDKPRNNRRIIAWLVGGGVLLVALAVLAIVLTR